MVGSARSGRHSQWAGRQQPRCALATAGTRTRHPLAPRQAAFGWPSPFNLPSLHMRTLDMHSTHGSPQRMHMGPVQGRMACAAYTEATIYAREACTQRHTTQGGVQSIPKLDCTRPPNPNSSPLYPAALFRRRRPRRMTLPCSRTAARSAPTSPPPTTRTGEAGGRRVP